MSKVQRLNKIQQVSMYVVYLILASVVLLVAFEYVIRIMYPQINYQGNQRSMFVENRFDQTMGLKPNSSGEFFGKEVSIDEYGFREMNSPSEYDKSWLFLGDSVTFGVGIEKDEIFPQLIQDEFPSIKIWNTAVVGYSALDYINVVRNFVPEHIDVEEIVLFFCLNDVYGNLFLNTDVSAGEKVTAFLKSNSKLYMLLKNVFFDRSRVYALHDVGFYEKQKAGIGKHLDAIANIKQIADQLNIRFLVVVLPYEYQLRVKGLRSPQLLLAKYFKDNNIESLDLYDDFSVRDSKVYYLYGDAMHLSSYGHKVVASRVLQELK